MNWNTLDADVNKIMNIHFSKGRSGKKVNKVVVHYNAGDLSIDGCYSVWQTREASAHYQVESSGRIGQLVWDSDTAWHASNWDVNCSSIGIEHANKSDGTITEACLDAGAHLVAAVCKYFGLGRPQWLVNVFPHKYFASTACPGQIYGSQKDAYIQRAQQWYDEMNGGTSTGGGSSSSGGSTSSKKSISEVAKDVIAGKYGNGDKRKAALEAAGYNYAEVQAEVNRQMGVTTKKSVSEIAEEVIAGKWGNGDDRKNRLTNAGYDYNAVQNEVNKQMAKKSGSTSGGMSARQFALEVWNEGKHGTGATRQAEAQRLGVDYNEAQRLINILAAGGKI